MQAAHLLIDSSRIFQPCDANIDLRRRFGRNHVGSDPPLTTPTLTVKPFFSSVKLEIFSI
jgi:hypothetical protein